MDPPALDGDTFRAAVARHAAGVVVVSTIHGQGFRGLTASSFTSVSLEPPLLLVCLDSLATTRDAIVEANAFNVSILSREQEFLAERFAGRAPLVDPSWREVPHRLGNNGIPILDGAAAWFECRLRQLHPAGDHDIAVGLVQGAGTGTAEPLVLWDRSFWRLT